MVRLKNPMAGIGEAGDAPPLPAVDADLALLARIDRKLREQLREVLADVRGRVLIVGALWPELAVSLAEEGRFVTLLDPLAERLAPLRDVVIERGLAQRLTLDARSYADVSFEAASFEAIVLYEPFPYLASPGALMAKCRREMRAGGQLLMRVILSEGAPFPDGQPSHGITVDALEVPPLDAAAARVIGARDRVLRGVWGTLRRLHLLRGEAGARVAEGALGDPGKRGPTWTSLAEAVSQNFVITDVRALQLASFELAELACSLRGPLGRLAGLLMGAAEQVDERLLARPGLSRALAPTVLVHATKQRELGRVFVLPTR